MNEGLKGPIHNNTFNSRTSNLAHEDYSSISLSSYFDGVRPFIEGEQMSLDDLVEEPLYNEKLKSVHGSSKDEREYDL